MRTLTAPRWLGCLLAFAYPDRIAQQRRAGGADYRLANGRAAQFGEADALMKHEWLVVADLGSRQGQREERIYLAADLDPALFELTIDNLLENAAKYASAGTPYVVRLETLGELLRLSVEDHGPGVPLGLDKKIWEAFERGDDRLSKATSGTGLGLSLVRGVALAHGGRADFERLEKGTRFVVEWPRKAEAP